MNSKLNIFRKFIFFSPLKSGFSGLPLYALALIFSSCLFESKKNTPPPNNLQNIIRVTGTVTDPQGSPCEGAIVAIRSFRSDSTSISLLSKPAEAEVFTDSSYSIGTGEFSFEAVPPGNYSVLSFYAPADSSDTLAALLPFAKITADTNLGAIAMLPIAHVTIELNLNGTPGSNLLCQIENFDLTRYSDSSGRCHFLMAQGNYVVTVGDPSMGALSSFSINVFSGEKKTNWAGYVDHRYNPDTP